MQEDIKVEGHPAGRSAANARGQSRSPAPPKLLRRLHLTYIATDELAIRRVRHGQGFRYVAADSVRGAESGRLAALAVPPAYEDVLYAADPRAHIQAIGRGDAGRLQYRYHPDWQRVREMRKARRLARLAEVLPQIRRSIARPLGASEPTRTFTLAAVIELVARSAIRPGSEQYARLRGTRGAATLLKSNVSVYGETVRLCFSAKGGKRIEKEVRAPRLAAAVTVLRQLPGRRLFQSASVAVLDALARAAPATSKRARRRQVLDAIRDAADDLGNTPAICAKSYVHETVVNAFEDGALEQFAETLRSSRSSTRAEKLLAQIAVQVKPEIVARPVPLRESPRSVLLQYGIELRRRRSFILGGLAAPPQVQ